MPDKKISELPAAGWPLPGDRDVVLETVYRTDPATAGSEDNFKVTVHRLQRRRYSRGSDLIRTDFATATGEGQFASAVTGSGAAVASATEPLGGFGVARLTTGTTATGIARGIWPTASAANNSVLPFGTSLVVYEARARLENLADGTDAFKALIGFGENGATDVDAIQFLHDASSPNWRAMCMSNGSATYVDTGVPVVAATWSEHFILVNAAGTEVRFYINDSLVALITTNIPVGDARATGVVHGILKSAGTNARILHMDYTYVDLEFPNGRRLAA